MKHVQMRDMLKLWESLFKKLPNAVIIDKEHGYFYISNLLWYIDGKLSEERRDELSSLINEYLPKNDGEKLMRTIADSYRDEGLNKGIAIGKNEGIAIGANTKATEIARRMLKENTEVKFIASVTGLSTDEIIKLKNTL
jgi:hypothetical protein